MPRKQVYMLCLALVSAIPGRLACAQDATFDTWAGRAWDAYHAGKWQEAEECFAQAKQAAPLRCEDWNGLSVSQRLQGKYEEALSTARAGCEAFGLPTNRKRLCEALIDVGDFANARTICDKLLADGVPDGEMEPLVHRSAFHRYELTFALDHKRFAWLGQELWKKNGFYQCYFPAEVPYQTSTAEALDCARFEDGRDAAGNRFFRIWPDGDRPARVVFHVTQVPTLFDLSRTPPPPYAMPPDVQHYLGKTQVIDPTTPLARQIAEPLKGRTLEETLDNITHWCTANFKYILEGEPGNTIVPGEAGSDQVLRTGRSRCGGHSAAAVALLRACGIPARGALGFSGIGKDHKPDWHAWTEIWVPGYYRHGAGYIAGGLWVPAYGGGARSGQLDPSLIRLAAETPEDAVENQPDTGTRIFFSMHIPDKPSGGPPANFTCRWIGSYIDTPR